MLIYVCRSLIRCHSRVSLVAGSPSSTIEHMKPNTSQPRRDNHGLTNRRFMWKWGPYIGRGGGVNRDRLRGDTNNVWGGGGIAGGCMCWCGELCLHRRRNDESHVVQCTVMGYGRYHIGPLIRQGCALEWDHIPWYWMLRWAAEIGDSGNTCGICYDSSHIYIHMYVVRYCFQIKMIVKEI